MRKQQHRRTSAKRFLPWAIRLLVLFVAVSPAAAQDEVARVSATWQVVNYDLDVRMAQPDADRSFAATAKLSLKNVSSRPASTLTLRISSSAEVSAVTINGGAVEFTKSEEKVGTGALQRILLRVPPVPPAGSLAATVDYKLTVKDNSG